MAAQTLAHMPPTHRSTPCPAHNARLSGPPAGPRSVLIVSRQQALRAHRLVAAERRGKLIARAGDEGAAEPEPAASGDESSGEERALQSVEDLVVQAKEQLAAGSVDPVFMESFVDDAAAEIAALKDALAAAEARAADLEPQLAKASDSLLRLNADFDNYRKRTASEKDALKGSVKGDIIQQLLPVIDNFELAKGQLVLESEGEKKVDASYQALYKQLVDVFRGMGLEAVPGEGAPFDPECHEAIMREPSEEVPDGTVLQEFRKGFRLGDRLLRASMVKVSFSESAPAAGAGGPQEGSQEGSQEQATEDVAA